MGPSPMPQHQPAGPNGSPSAWLSPTGSAQSQGFMRGMPQLPSRGPSQPQNIQSGPQALQPSPMQQNNMGPQRPGSTTRQLPPGQLPTQISPSLSNQFASNQISSLQMQNGQSLAQFPLPPPLEKAKFEESYPAFCNSRGIVLDDRLTSVDNRPVDLHALHYNVLSEGGSVKASLSHDILC